MKQLLFILSFMFIIGVTEREAFGAKTMTQKPEQKLEQAARKNNESQKKDKADERIKRLIYSRPRRFDWKSKLNLNKDQIKYVQNIYHEDKEKINSLITQMENSLEQLRQIYEQEENQIKSILDESQRIKFDKFKRRTQLNDSGDWKGEKPSRKKMTILNNGK